MAAPARPVLILGGTGEARTLAGLLVAAGIPAVTSLAGVTGAPAPVAGETRRGGFGGAEGLAAYLREEDIGLVADATHPFAARISRHAAQACADAGVPYVRLDRPAWRPQEGDDWQMVASVRDAASALPAGTRALVTVGRKEIAPFLARSDTAIVMRMIEPPETPLPAHVRLVQARPPFTAEEERRLFDAHRIDMLVAKNSGGAATAAKLAVARERGLGVIMVARPDKPEAPGAATAEGLARLIGELLPA